MATRTIARMFDSYADASAAVRELEAAGFSHDDVSLIANRGDDATDGTTTTTEAESDAGSGAGTGATIGTLIGGGAGLLAGLGALAIPGVGPIVAAGWLVAALTGAGVGAAAGGLLGGLTGAGLSEEHANVYAEGVRRGGNLVTVRADETRATEAERILMRHNPVDVEARAGEYRAGGWSRYDENAPMTTPASGLGTAAGVGTTTAAGQMGTRTRVYPATDAAVGAPDGTPGNPPGTMASRGLDQAAGTNVSGAYPGNEGRGGTGGGLTGTDAPDGTPGNPPGTKLSRGIDEVAGTNISGAHPENEDGTTRNPPGTAAERATDRALGTNTAGTNPTGGTPRR
jgi:heat induced stress protein YflT